MTHIDANLDLSNESEDDLQEAKIITSEQQDAVGVPVFFSAEDIEKQGIDPNEVEKVGVRVEDGFVVFVPIGTEMG